MSSNKVVARLRLDRELLQRVQGNDRLSSELRQAAELLLVDISEPLDNPLRKTFMSAVKAVRVGAYAKADAVSRLSAKAAKGQTKEAFRLVGKCPCMRHSVSPCNKFWLELGSVVQAIAVPMMCRIALGGA